MKLPFIKLYKLSKNRPNKIMQDKRIKNQFYVVETLQIAQYSRTVRPIVTKQTLFYSEFQCGVNKYITQFKQNVWF